ncbi:ATP synthase subunit I [Ruminococcus sp.]|uniref:ATP synthase subunit I n=1 Tax=Ruminococcus sp. TaxID=41978 RepID=UPI0025D283B1|nr:ATP synthase subunit I [Ruminococcus sp.]
MKKVDKTVLHETGYIAVFVLIFSTLMQGVFLIIGKWDYTVLLGNLFGGAVAVGNFFLMGLTVQAAVNKEEKQAKNMMKLSQSGRMLLLFAAVAIGVLLPCFSTWTSILPLFFPRIAIALRPLFLKKEQADKAAVPEGVRENDE